MGNMNGSTWKIIGVVSGLVIILLGAAVAYGMLSGDVAHSCERISKIEPKVAEHDRQITILETRQSAIYEGVKRIEAKLDELK